jgi:hypothetical protein
VAGFLWRYNISGGRQLIYEFTMADTETLTVGDMLNLQTGEVDLAATNDTLMLGPLVGAKDPDDNVAGQPGRISGTDSTTVVLACVNPDAVLADEDDANARVVGVNLDIAGATGAQGVAAASNNDFFVVKDSAAVEDTMVRVAFGEHYLDP